MHKITKKLAFIIILIFMFVIIPSEVFANTLPSVTISDRVIFGGNFRLRDGEIHQGSLLVFGGTVIIDQGATVTGDLLLFGGNLVLKGKVEGTVIVLGGVGEIEETALVGGDLVSPGAAIDISEDAKIVGQIFIEDQSVFIPDLPNFQIEPISPIVRYSANSASVIWFFIRMFAFGALAIFTMLFIPKQAEQVRSTLVEHPIPSGGFGLLSLVILFPVTLLAITIILSPVTFIYWLIVFCGSLFGWIVVGLELGDRIGKLVNQEWSPAVSAGLGTITLGLLGGAFGLVFWGIFGFIFATVVCSVGLGAVFMTRFGTKDYPEIKGKILTEKDTKNQ